jgi:poly(hydroxyalkanoate) depolymerase family esterase
MKGHRMPSFDYRFITDTIERSLAAAGLAQPAGAMHGIADIVDRALASSGVLHPRDSGPSAAATGPGESIEAGEFATRSFTNAAGTREYMLYVPSTYSPASEIPAPLVVMLHGCSQTPEDFAAGTRMNALAERHGFLVAYPAQAAKANQARCWKWYSRGHQLRERGEPSIVAGIAREIIASHRVDPHRVFVAGLSAGGAMAVVLGTTYPELFSAVGVHSGLPYGAAHDVHSAFAAMKGEIAQAPGTEAHGVPTIVFHGSRDGTVNARNGSAIVEQAIRRSGEPELRAQASTGSATGGSSYRHTGYVDAAGCVVVEHWELQGAGHAWSGGSARGSFTDPNGPDASAQMIRFFYAQPQAGNA